MAPRRIDVAANVIVATLAVFRKRHEWGRRHEGIVYWAGREARNGDWIVTTCIAPHAVTTPGSYRTTSVGNAEAICAMNRENVQLIAQVHSHPGRMVDHSAGDEIGALMPFDGFISVVVPYYGVRGMWPLDVMGCGVHEYSRHGFRRLRDPEVGDRFGLLRDFLDLR